MCEFRDRQDVNLREREMDRQTDRPIERGRKRLNSPNRVLCPRGTIDDLLYFI